MRYLEWFLVIINFFLYFNYNNMSYLRKRQALYGYAPSANALSQTTTCTDPITGRTYSIPAGATYNNGGPMKFGLYPTVGKSIGFLNILSNCCRSGAADSAFKGITLGSGVDCATA